MLNFCCVILLYTRVVLGQTCLGEQWCTIADEPEVYEDWDPAQREAEGPKSSMDYSEFFISTKKKTDRPCPYSGRTRVELHVGHTHGSNNAPYSLLLGLCFSTHITFMLWLAVNCMSVNFGSQTICTTRCCDKDYLILRRIFQAPDCLKLDYN